MNVIGIDGLLVEFSDAVLCGWFDPGARQQASEQGADSLVQEEFCLDIRHGRTICPGRQAARFLEFFTELAVVEIWLALARWNPFRRWPSVHGSFIGNFALLR